MRVSESVGASHHEAQSAPPTRLVKAAHEFEAQLMKEMLKPLTASEGFGDDENDTGSGSILKDFAGEALGQALSMHGGLGIARSIVRSLSHLDNGSGSEAAPDAEGTEQFNRHRDP